VLKSRLTEFVGPGANRNLTEYKAADVLGERYEIAGVLGQGGMATVYLAHDRVRQGEIALKVLHQHLSHRQSMRERMRREVVAASRLRHPHALVAYELLELGDELALSMPVHRGRTLDEHLDLHGSLSAEQIQGVLEQVGGALSEAHRQGIIHRDITPSNILLDDDCRAMLTDFGLARLLDMGTASTSALPTIGSNHDLSLWLEVTKRGASSGKYEICVHHSGRHYNGMVSMI
jgi:eukaryotic-like serine/threonine-protein kinase